MLSTHKQQINNPRACILLLTLGCNLRCRMCHLWRNKENDIIKPTLDEWRRFILSLHGFSGGGFNVIFGGGEPLLCADMLVELIASCRQKGLRTSLATSGYLLNEDMAARLASAGLDYAALTLYSLNKETHNFLRGMPDSYERLLEAITCLSRFGNSPEIAIDTVIMEPNLGELLELADWALRDKRIHSIFFQAVMQPFHSHPQEAWYHREEYGFLWPKDIAQVDALIDELIRMKRDPHPGERDKINNPVSQLKLFKSYFRNPEDFIKGAYCNVASGSVFTVSPDGSVNLCPYMKPVGNIRESDIRDIWHSQEARDRYREISLCQKNCHHIVNCWYEEESLV